jgi:hypothetical protein
MIVVGEDVHKRQYTGAGAEHYPRAPQGAQKAFADLTVRASRRTSSCGRPLSAQRLRIVASF